MASRVALLMLFAMCLGLDVITEQPGSSLMFQHHRFKQISGLSSAGGIRLPLKVASTFMGSFGAPTPKLTFLMGTPQWLRCLHRSSKFKKGNSGHDIVKRRIDKHGREVFTGSKV